MWVYVLLLLSLVNSGSLVSRNGYVLDRTGENIRREYAQAGYQQSCHPLQYPIRLASHERLQDLHSGSHLYGVFTASCYLTCMS
jgi:hypothetical protein